MVALSLGRCTVTSLKHVIGLWGTPLGEGNAFFGALLGEEGQGWRYRDSLQDRSPRRVSGAVQRQVYSARPPDGWEEPKDGVTIMDMNSQQSNGGEGSEHPGREIQAPHEVHYEAFSGSVFLAGTIEMNKATKWQGKMVEQLKDLPVAILNPRRDDWDPSWGQTPDDARFNEQVKWELDGLDRVDVVALYFEAGTISPICLQEHGYLAGTRAEDVVVCCPEDFWRHGNVEMLSERLGMKLVRTYGEMVSEVRKRLERIVALPARSQGAP
jgi:hypothetical protein